MSMIDEQINKLREISHSLELFPIHDFSETSRAIREAADTIETLSAKLAAENMERSEAYYNNGWIYCGDGNNLLEKTGFYMVTKEMRETGGRFTGKSCFDAEKRLE